MKGQGWRTIRQRLAVFRSMRVSAKRGKRAQRDARLARRGVRRLIELGVV